MHLSSERRGAVIQSPAEVQSTTAPLDRLRERMTGRLLVPSDGDYAALATPWNTAVASAPVAVAEVVDARDVAAVVRFAAQYGLDAAVRCTGHGATDLGRPTVLVHTGLLDEVTIDPGTPDTSARARVGAGVRWRTVLDAAGAHGLAAPAGAAPGVGVVGYLTGGGLGPVARTLGYSSDHVTAFELVTGDGERRRATATENTPLFWGLRGGKGALGIVTAVELALLPLAEIYGGCLFFDGADAAHVAQAWRGWAADLPEEATTSLAFLRPPATETVSSAAADPLRVAVRFGWVGDAELGYRALAPLAAAAPVVAGSTQVMPYAALGSIHADSTEPRPVHDRSLLLDALTSEAVDALVALAGPGTGCPLSLVEIRQLGGALSRTPEVSSAVSHRDAAFHLLASGSPDPAGDETGDRLVQALQSWSSGATQPGFVAASRPEQVLTSYDAAVLARLGKLAADYDPLGVLAAAHPIRGTVPVRRMKFSTR
jgi:hypothetical protein